eukprot:521823_1
MPCVSLISIPYFVVAIFQWILLASMSKYTYKFFVGANSKQRFRLSKKIFIPVSMFIVISLLAEFFIGVITLLLSFGKNKCITLDRIAQIGVFCSFLFIAQIYLMMLMMFQRLKLVFSASVFSIPKRITVPFLILLALGPLLGCIVAVIARFQGSHFESTTTFAAILLFFISLCIISLTSLFIFKLVEVYRSNNPQPQLISQVTKATILCLITILAMLIFVFILLITSRVVKNTHAQLTSRIFMNAIDIYINFLCIILSFQYFNKSYDQCCHRVDTKCRYCWGKIMSRDEMELRYIMDAQSQTRSKNNQSVTANAISNEKPDDLRVHSKVSDVKSTSVKSTSEVDRSVVLSVDSSVQKSNEVSHNE